MIATGVITPFMVPMKVTMMLALMISLPWVLYQAWAFVAPGLYTHEKRLVAPLIISSSALFILGVAFCYYFVFGTVFKFINEFAPKSISVAPDIENYLDFVLTMCLAFGLTFEVPVVVIVLVRPPGTGNRSSTRTRTPAFARSMAQASPPGPAPMMLTVRVIPQRSAAGAAPSTCGGR